MLAEQLACCSQLQQLVGLLEFAILLQPYLRDFVNSVAAELRNFVNYLNLQAIIKKQLITIGVLNKNIKETKECTFCDKEKYFSYRRDKPVDVEAMLAYVVIK